MTTENEEIEKLIEERKGSKSIHTLEDVIKQLGFTENELKDQLN